jgi:hypothetical protein
MQPRLLFDQTPQRAKGTPDRDKNIAKYAGAVIPL